MAAALAQAAGSPARLAPPTLQVQGLRLVRGGRALLDGLDLTVQAGEIHVLLGANGAGKTTLACALMGCEGYQPDAGQMLLDGTELRPLKLHERARLGLTLAWQEPARFEGVLVREYLGLGQRQDPGAKRADADPAAVLRRVGLDPERYLGRAVDRALSGGERHRIELASVLAMQPRLAMLDEPVAGIDMLSVGPIVDAIGSLREGGGAVLLITHQEEVVRVADRASQLCAGRVVFAGTPAEAVARFRRRACVRCNGQDCGDERA
jgi:Fe-S cluster assembly ATP-binding protein